MSTKYSFPALDVGKARYPSRYPIDSVTTCTVIVLDDSISRVVLAICEPFNVLTPRTSIRSSLVSSGLIVLVVTIDVSLSCKQQTKWKSFIVCFRIQVCELVIYKLYVLVMWRGGGVDRTDYAALKLF